MKKIVFSLIVLVTYFNTYANDIQINEYFNKPVFNLLKLTNNNLYQNLINGKLQKSKVNDKDVTVIQIENGYFIDDSEMMVYSEVNKKNQTMTVNNFSNNSKAIIKLNVNNNLFTNIVEDKSLNIVDFFDPKIALANKVTFRGCRDDVGFALCYAAVLISSIAIASSDGPLPFMDAAAISYAITATAGCYRSNCK